jgi:hypothetical protein
VFEHTNTSQIWLLKVDSCGTSHHASDTDMFLITGHNYFRELQEKYGRFNCVRMFSSGSSIYCSVSKLLRILFAFWTEDAVAHFIEYSVLDSRCQFWLRVPFLGEEGARTIVCIFPVSLRCPLYTYDPKWTDDTLQLHASSTIKDIDTRGVADEELCI